MKGKRLRKLWNWDSNPFGNENAFKNYGIGILIGARRYTSKGSIGVKKKIRIMTTFQFHV